ncbi:MAG TPA: LPS assembly lipoprotein LptE [bacterium]|nr:LPS assembly lipoprotein LptE [bacterium]
MTEKRIKRTFLSLGALVAPIFFLSGCHPAVLIVPSYIKTVGVELFQNRTSYFGLETLFTRATIRQFETDGRIPLEDPDHADMVVKVVIRQLDKIPSYYDPKTNAVLQYRLSVTYDIAAVDQREKKTFFEDNGKIHSLFYYTPDYVGAVTQTEDQAMAQLAEDMARTIVRRVLEGY